MNVINTDDSKELNAQLLVDKLIFAPTEADWDEYKRQAEEFNTQMKREATLEYWKQRARKAEQSGQELLLFHQITTREFAELEAENAKLRAAVEVAREYLDGHPFLFAEKMREALEAVDKK